MFACDGAALAGLPSLISSIGGDGGEIDLYAVPPVAYPDGRMYFKAGTGAFSAPLDTAAGIEPVKDWFRGPGRAHEIAYIRACVEGLLPVLSGSAVTTSQCAVTVSPTNHPYIAMIDGGPIGVAVGGNGYAAKSCLEIGRIAGDMIVAGNSWDHSYQALGLSGTNDAVVEISTMPPLNLEQRTKFLIKYPHGCLEQTTSTLFPQLYLSDLTNLDETDQEEIADNIKSGIDRLRLFQRSS